MARYGERVCCSVVVRCDRSGSEVGSGQPTVAEETGGGRGQRRGAEDPQGEIHSRRPDNRDASSTDSAYLFSGVEKLADLPS